MAAIVRPAGGVTVAGSADRATAGEATIVPINAAAAPKRARRATNETLVDRGWDTRTPKLPSDGDGRSKDA